MSANPVPVAQTPDWPVRTMQTADIAQIIEIETRAYEFPWTAQNFLDSLNAGYVGLVMTGADDAVIGYTILMPAVDDLHILNLCIAPAYQGRGAGQRMLAEVRRVSLELGIHMVLLEVRPSNTHAIRLYERFGFASIGRRRNYYPARQQTREDAIVMRAKVKWSDVDDSQ